MKINLNDKIQCTLTIKAKDILRSYLEDLFEGAQGEQRSKLIERSFNQLTKENDSGKAEFNFWEFCNIFGPAMFVGSSNFLKDIEIK